MANEIIDIIDIAEMGKRAKAASRELAVLTTEQKNLALKNIAAELIAESAAILAANAEDLAAAEQKGLTPSFIDRLRLTQERLQDMADGLLALTELADPIGEQIAAWTAAEGISIVQQRVPLGVVGIIYEARPNVTADAAGICLKCGNAVILRGGSDALKSNLAVGNAIRRGLKKTDIAEDAVQIVADTSREEANRLMHLNEYIDVLIPRGGKGLIQAVLRETSVPVIETGAGNCHIYVEQSAKADVAKAILLNSKCQRPAVCNATETLLIDEGCAERLLPELAAALIKAGVEIRGCEETAKILSAAGLSVTAATEEDWATEYNDYIIACKVVKDYREAAAHINRFGTRHSECIITENSAAAEYFQAMVDAAAVYVNASTRFTDGFQFGFGAEIGISTQKLHARGPMGLIAMTSYKYLINGEGQTRP